ncbi:MAG: glycosyltransferase family 4 protein [Candidatus Bathyarchaeota archaeon]|nr:MAG: glycosyltransferase family 4 protein [Candidatus Bathyarchaeota archaeon]
MREEKKLKIVYLNPFLKDDPNRTQYQRPKYLSLKSRLFIFTGRKTVIPEEIRRNVTIIRGPLDFGRTKVLYQLWCFYKVLMLHRRFRFDLVYSTSHYFSSVPAFLLKLLGFKWVADIWDHPVLPLRIWEVSRQRKVRGFLGYVVAFIGVQIMKKGLKYSNLVIAAIHPSALTEFHISPQKILKVTNGVDISITQPERLKREKVRLRLFYVGPVREARGLDVLLHSTAILKRKKKNVELILVGSTRDEDENYLNKMVERLGLEKDVNYFGILDHKDVLNLMGNSDICIFPFPKKDVLDCIYPIKIFEYMAMGKAIVTTRLKGVSRIIKDDVTGLLVEPDNPTEMADAILSIDENQALKERLEVNARKASNRYDWKTINGMINEKLAELQ